MKQKKKLSFTNLNLGNPQIQQVGTTIKYYLKISGGKRINTKYQDEGQNNVLRLEELVPLYHLCGRNKDQNCPYENYKVYDR